MKFAPYIDSWNASPHVPMGSAFHCVPQVHALYFGPAECGRHLFASFALDGHASFLVVTDVQMALGRSEDLVCEAVGEILERQPETRAFILCTGCQTAFIALDGEDLARRVRERYGVGCVYLSVNRMAAENTPGRGRVNVPGGDRFHTRSTLMRLIESGRAKGDAADSRLSPPEGTESIENRRVKGGAGRGAAERPADMEAAAETAAPGGLLFLSDTAFAPGNEALSLAGGTAASGQPGSLGAGAGERKAGAAASAQFAGSGAGAQSLASAASAAGTGCSAPAARVKTSAEWESFDDFLAARDAAAVVSTAAVWNESARVLAGLLDVPVIEAPVGYVLSETDAAWKACGDALGCDLAPFLADARQAAVDALAEAAGASEGAAIDLDLRGTLRPWNLAWALLEAGCTLGSITLDGHALRYREQDDEPWYRRVREREPQLVADCERRARENDHPHGASLLVAEGRWEAPSPARPGLAQREGAHWGYGAIAHVAGLLAGAAKEEAR